MAFFPNSVVSIATFCLIFSCSTSPSINYDEAISPEHKLLGNRDTISAKQTQKKELLENHKMGSASFSADEKHGYPTASGEIYNMRDLVASHPTLPFGTKVKVTRIDNTKSVIVRIIDHKPAARKNIIDISFEAAKRLGFVEEGSTQVSIKIVD